MKKGYTMKTMPAGLAVAPAALAGLLWLAVGAALAQPAAFDLITEGEARREAAATSALEPTPEPPRPVRPRGLPPPAGPRQAPAIEVLLPLADGPPVLSPLRLEVAFRPPVDARIVPSSFRIFYGVLKLDLTERLQRHATLSENGVVVEQAQVPQGTHRVFVRVADDKGRVAEQAVVIRVAGTR